MPETKREAEELRQEIAKVDQQLVALLDKRARAARRIRELRKHPSPLLAVTDQAAIRALVARSNGDMPEQALREVLRQIFAACLTLELPVTVAHVGPEGGPGYVAARERFGLESTLISTGETALALDEVSRKRAVFAIVPFESSSEGPVEETIVALASSDLRVAEMLDSAFDLHLMNRSGRAADIDKIYATPADHAACERSLVSQAAHATVLEAKTPRAACELAAAAQDGRAAAIAHETFGAQLGLEVAQRSVLDRRGDRVRHAIVAHRPSGRTDADVTSLVFTVRDAAGSLLDVLKVFAERGVNLANIHSHPVRGEAWSYLFYVEVAGHLTDRHLVTAFEEMKRLTRSFKVLGSYPAP